MEGQRIWRAGGPADLDPISTWADGLANAFVRLDYEGRRDGCFHGAIAQTDAGALKFSRVKAEGHAVLRRAEHARAASADVVFLNLQIAGVSMTAQHGRERRAGPYDLAVADTLAPFGILHREPFDLFCAAIPRAMTPAPLLKAGGLALSRSENGRAFAKLMFGYAALALSPAIGKAGLALAGRHFLDIVALAAEEAAGSPPMKRSEASIEILRAFIAEHYRDVRLNAGRAAHVFGVSERYVQKLFAQQGETFSEAVAATRLEAAARAFGEERTAEQSVAEVAYDNGFSDLSYFHRAFKARFGETPGAYRDLRAVRLRPQSVRSRP